MLKRTPIKRKRSKPRRGRDIDKDYMGWLHTELCIVAAAGWHECRGRITVHHVRRYGEPKKDRRGLPACEGHHLHDFGEFCIERIGKVKFQRRYGIDLERLIEEHNARYEALRN
jgi:hypothetical protein